VIGLEDISEWLLTPFCSLSDDQILFRKVRFAVVISRATVTDPGLRYEESLGKLLKRSRYIKIKFLYKGGNDL